LLAHYIVLKCFVALDIIRQCRLFARFRLGCVDPALVPLKKPW
jgi:hypothetical protein